MRARDYITGDSFSIEPTADGWWRTEPAPANLAAYYGATYYGSAGRRRFPAVVEWLQGRLYAQRAGLVARAVGRAGRVLDVGCGPGHLLARFAARGWQAIGTEVSPEAAQIPRERYGLDVRAGDVVEQRFGSAEFDAIISWHSLEHVRDPGRVLDEIARILKPGGVLLLSVPDFSSPEAQADPAAWFHLDVPRHLHHFPEPVLRAALERRGLWVESETSSAPEYDAFSLVQTWQNRMGLPQNLLYLVLKRVSPRESSPPWQRVTAVLLAVIQLPAAAVITWFRGRRREGAVVVFLARKSPPPPSLFRPRFE
jgi:SAM-dependent methyltransferase